MMPLREWLLLLAAFATKASGKYIRESDLPRNVQFLPLVDNGGVSRSSRHLETEDDADGSFYGVQPFVEGESDYDEYQQAWRYLGFMIDCNDGRDSDNDDGSWDGGTGEGCHRYLLWAAYVDLEYEGGGIGEYQFWNRDAQAWDTTSCDYGDNNNDGSSRCAKMDCHLEDTHWSLLGLFKHISSDDWMEQLFKHEGFCVWSEEEYQFMKNAREAWPQGCSEASLDDGSYVYYDIMPKSEGQISIGLYTDTRCMEEYQGEKSVEDVLGNILLEAGSGDGQDNGEYDFSGFSFAESLSLWDSLFDTWTICQPCIAYDLNNVGYNADDDASRGSAYNTYTYGYDDDANYYQQSDFDCYDDADYTNVNQCMKFMAKTEMLPATFRDLSLASTQGTLVNYVPLEGYTNRSIKLTKAAKWRNGIFFIISVSILAGGIFMVYTARKELENVPQLQFIQEPLFVAA